MREKTREEGQYTEEQSKRCIHFIKHDIQPTNPNPIYA
jgi:hypothetical protein